MDSKSAVFSIWLSRTLCTVNLLAVLWVLFIMYSTIHTQLASYETLTLSSCTDDTHWLMWNGQYVWVDDTNYFTSNCVRSWRKQTSLAITSVNIYFAWIYIHVGSIISCSTVTCHYQQSVWQLLHWLRLSCSTYITSLPGLVVTASHATC